MNNNPITIIAAKRTPIGYYLGDLKNLTSTELGGKAINAALKAACVSMNQFDSPQVIMGCVLPAGLGQAPARQAAHRGGLDFSVPCVTVNKMCASGMQAIIQAHDQLVADSFDVVIAGGMESMSNAPHLIRDARTGLTLSKQHQLIDHMFCDGLEDAYEHGKKMGAFADDTAAALHITREKQDDFALQSVERARTAQVDGCFTEEITPIMVNDVLVDHDEGPIRAKPEKISQLKPAFNKDGTVTAANASSISDGAAALVLMRESTANAKSHK